MVVEQSTAPKRRGRINFFIIEIRLKIRKEGIKWEFMGPDFCGGVEAIRGGGLGGFVSWVLLDKDGNN